MPELPTCECIEGLPIGQQLSAIYCAVFAWTEDADLPSCVCVDGLTFSDKLTAIYEAILAASDDSSLPSVLCVRGYPIGEQLLAIYEALLTLTDDESLPTAACVAGMTLSEQIDAVFCALLGLEVSPYDPDAEDFFLRAGIVNTTLKGAVNTLVVDLKAENLWDKMVALYPFVGGTASSHAENLKSSSYTITWNGVVNHTSTGVESNGTTGYGNTNMPRTALPLVGVHLSAYLQAVESYPAFHAAIGVDDFGTGNSEFTELWHAAAHAFLNNSTNAKAEFGINPGMVIGTRSVTHDQILDPAAVVFTAQASTAPAANIALNLFVLALNRSGAAELISPETYSLISAGSVLTLAEALSFRTIVNAFQTTLGRNV